MTVPRLCWPAVALVCAGCVCTGCASSLPARTAESQAVRVTVSLPSTTTTTSTTTTAPRRRHHRPAPPLPLTGKVVGIDPGHNGGNAADPAFINRIIWNGRNRETCDTTGTATDQGYSEAQFNWNVARYLSADLRALGARVVLTRHSNAGVGPCVTTRAQIIDRAHANVAIDIHADGGPPNGRGVAILLPVADGPNDRVIASSLRFGRILLADVRAATGLPDSTYDGIHGFARRNDLAGLNLTTVPKVLIEVANMRNAQDAALLVTRSFQRRVGAAFAAAIRQFLR